MFEFSGDIVLVTGAAGNLGRAVVNAFLVTGATVCALDHRQGRLQGSKGFSNTSGELHLFENVDVTNRQAVWELSEKVQAQVGKVNVLVNTVGGFTYGEMVHELSSETWEQMMSLNVRSFLNIAHAFIPGMQQEHKGKVVSVGSRSSFKGNAKTGAYAAAKSALLRLTESMAAELMPVNIQVNCVLPGTIDTPENREAMPNADFEKWVAPEAIAQVILFLSSPAADAISGTAIPIYGKSYH
ncbi:MAG: SDR family NAD(P)-dependent oxidoreductase [Chloroflexota bacterium]|jgi:NAD(P)-dependent dehydrogenase (short-subunit alcohol dehydrogenase family)|nr:SDR family NAD(P)-dependent oxidoreductase [Chloroflexota bacterium]